MLFNHHDQVHIYYELKKSLSFSSIDRVHIFDSERQQSTDRSDREMCVIRFFFLPFVHSLAFDSLFLSFRICLAYFTFTKLKFSERSPKKSDTIASCIVNELR